MDLLRIHHHLTRLFWPIKTAHPSGSRLRSSEIVTSTKSFFVAYMLFARSDVFPFPSLLAIPKVIDGNLQFKLVVSQYGTLFGLSQQRSVCRDVLLGNLQRGSIISFYNEVFPEPEVVECLISSRS